MLVGEPTEDGLVYRGRVGSGIAGKEGQRLLEVLEPLLADASPFADDVPTVDALGTVWVRPEVVVDVAALGHDPGEAAAPAGLPRRPRRPDAATDLEEPAMAEQQTDEVLVDVDGRTLKISNLGKVMYPTTGTTKGEVLNYYARVAAGAAAAPRAPRGDPDPLAARHRRHAVLREEPALRGADVAALGDRPVDRARAAAATRSATRSSTGWPTSPTSPTWPPSSCTCTSGRSATERAAEEPEPAGHRPRPRAPRGPAGVLRGRAAGARQARRARPVRGAGDLGQQGPAHVRRAARQAQLRRGARPGPGDRPGAHRRAPASWWSGR